MALADVGRMFWPSPLCYPLTFTAAGGNYRFTASTTRVGRIARVPHHLHGKQVDTIHARIGTAATPNELRAGIYILDSTGNPTTTGYDGGGDNYGSAGTAANATSAITLSRAVTLTAGDALAIVLEPHDADAVDMYLGSVTHMNNPGRLPGTRRYTGSWAAVADHPAIGVKTTDGIHWQLNTALITANAAWSVNTGSAGTIGDEIATKLVMPFKARVVGIWASTFLASAANVEYILYHGGSSQSSGVVDGDLLGNVQQHHEFDFPTPVTVAAGTTCYIAAKPNTATNVTLNYTTHHAQEWFQSCGLPSGTVRAYRVDGGSWTETDTTNLPGLGLIIDQLDDGASAGGFVPHSGPFSSMWSG